MKKQCDFRIRAEFHAPFSLEKWNVWNVPLLNLESISPNWKPFAEGAIDRSWNHEIATHGRGVHVSCLAVFGISFFFLNWLLMLHGCIFCVATKTKRDWSSLEIVTSGDVTVTFAEGIIFYISAEVVASSGPPKNVSLKKGSTTSWTRWMRRCERDLTRWRKTMLSS